jgi:hypothetical protein
MIEIRVTYPNIGGDNKFTTQTWITFTLRSTLAVSWLPIPLDQNWAMTSSNVWPPTTLKVKFLAAGEEKVTTLLHFKGLCNGRIWHKKHVSKGPYLTLHNRRLNILPELYQQKIFEVYQNLICSWLLQPKMHHVALLYISFLYGLMEKKEKKEDNKHWFLDLWI